MTKQRSLVLMVAALGAGAFLGSIGTTLFAKRAQVAPHLTRAGLLRVHPGMRANEVARRIGYPIELAISGSRSVDPIGHTAAWPGPYVWVYARPGWFDRLEVNVIMANNAVSSVNVEYDDARVYSTEGAAAPAAPKLSTLLK